MAGSSSLMRRLRAIEARRDGNGKRGSVHAMTDRDLYRLLNVRDPATGAVRFTLTDAELSAIAAGHAP